MKNRRKYEKEFKDNAVKLHLKTNKPVYEIETELGVSHGTIGRWVKEYQKKGLDSFPGNGQLSGKDLEIMRLKKENKILKEERDILKKSLGIFSQDL